MKMKVAKNGNKRNPAQTRRDILKDQVVLRQWRQMPPLEYVIDAVERFTRYYFQLGFIPKYQFIQQLQSDCRSISVFLILSILSISARMTPSLVEMYGSSIKAAEHFMDRASQIVQYQTYTGATLEKCQAFYLLSIAQQGSGLQDASHVSQR